METKMRKTPFQLHILEKTYAGNAYPTKKVRAKLSAQLSLTDRQLQMWFCNRRIKDGKYPNKMGKTKKRAWRNTNVCTPKKKRKVLAEAASKKIFSSVTNDADSPEWAQALEPVRKLPTNVGSRIRRCIHESLNRNPPEWVREILEHSISKQVYKGNASGFTKRAVISVLEKVRVDIPQPKPTEKKEKSGLRTLYGEEIGYNMGKTKERAWGNTNTRTQKKKLKPTQRIWGATSNPMCLGHAWRNTNTHTPKKLKQTQKLLDDDVQLLDPKQEQCDLAENVSPMSDFLEELSSCQNDIVCVHGYKVKRSIATILEAIFKKHGDITANCVFKTSSMRTHFLEVVCEIVKRIQLNDTTEMVKDIECLVDAEAANINVSWIQSHFEAFQRRKETSKEYSLLMEMKVNTSLVKQAAQIDLRERCEELMRAQEQFKTAERCVRVLHLVEKNLNDNMLEAKAKLDSCINHPVV